MAKVEKEQQERTKEVNRQAFCHFSKVRDVSLQILKTVQNLRGAISCRDTCHCVTVRGRQESLESGHSGEN